MLLNQVLNDEPPAPRSLNDRVPRDVESVRRRMYEFLGEDPGEALPLSAETRTTAGFDKEDPQSFWRHGQVGDWKRYSTDEFKRWFKAAAGDVLAELKYEKDQDW